MPARIFITPRLLRWKRTDRRPTDDEILATGHCSTGVVYVQEMPNPFPWRFA